MLIATTACSIAIFQHREQTLGNQYVNGVARPAGPEPPTSTVARLNENLLESMDHILYEEQFQVVPEVRERSLVCFASGADHNLTQIDFAD